MGFSTGKEISKGVGNWLRKQAAIIGLAMSNVEKNAFGQNGGSLDSDVAQERRHNQGTLADSLINGVITEEVENLRWRMYKVLQASSGVKTTITGYDENNMPITKTTKFNSNSLKNVRVDSTDNYPVVFIINNDDLVMSGNESMDNDNINVSDNPIITYNENGQAISATHGEISGDKYFATHKSDKLILVYRECLPKFEIEKYTQKLVVRKISETERLLEFYVSKYPDEFNRRSRLFISDIKKIIENKTKTDLVNILEVGFITYQAIGVDDFLEYQFKVKGFDKIIEFDGSYVIKFKADVIVNGKNILEGFRKEELDNKYKTKEKKKQR